MEMEAALGQAGIETGCSVLAGLALYGGKKMYKFMKVKYGYVKHMRKNFANLEVELIALCYSEEEILSLIRTKRKMKLTPTVESWLEEVKKIKDEFEELKTEYQSPGARKFLFGVYPAPESVKLGKRIVEKTKVVVSLKVQINEIPMVVEGVPTSTPGRIRKFFKKLIMMVKKARAFTE